MKTTREIAEYVGRTFKYGSDARLAVENLAIPVLPEPADPPAGATRTQTRIWEKKVDAFIKREILLNKNIKTIFSLAFGQCSDEHAMPACVEALDNYDTMKQEGQGIELLMQSRTLCSTFKIKNTYLTPSMRQNNISSCSLKEGRKACHRTNLSQTVLELR